MKISKSIKAAAALIGFGLCTSAMAENPIIQTYYSPDPAPVVFGDTVCVYTGNDEGGDFFTMHGWRVSCTTDMVNWTDMGELILSNESFGGNAKKNGDWAAQVIRRNGKYYYYVTVESTVSPGGRAINVAVADKPQGPFKDARNGKHLAGPDWAYIDPTVWIDDDGQAYLYWGNPRLYWAKLKENMIELDGEIHTTDMSRGFSPGGESVYTEGPWIHKRNKKYYMIYASHGTGSGEKISYSTSDGPTGPWTWGGIIMEPSNGSAFTNHCGIIDFKGRSFFFYHNQKNVGGSGYSRSAAVEEFTWGEDGSIPQIKQSDNGVVKPIKNLDPYQRVEAETKAWVGGIDVDRSQRDVKGAPFTLIKHVKSENGAVYLTNMNDKFYTKVRSVDMGDGADSIYICTKGKGGKLEVHAGSTTGTLLASIDVPASDKWQENGYKVSDAVGVDDLYFVVKQAGFDFDYWYMVNEKTAIPQTPYKGVAAAVPGKIEAENYDEGGHNKSFYDNDRENQGKAYREDEVDIVDISDSKCGDAACTGYAIGYTEADEWVEYTIDVKADAKYNITANIATSFETAGMQLFVDGEAITEAITFEKVDTVFTTYKVVDVGSVELKKGEHVLKLLITGGYLNVDWLTFTDPNNPNAAIARNMRLVPQNASYNVFGATGKFLGRIDNAGANMAATLKQAGFANGMYILRGLNHNTTLRVQVR